MTAPECKCPAFFNAIVPPSCPVHNPFTGTTWTTRSLESAAPARTHVAISLHGLPDRLGYRADPPFPTVVYAGPSLAAALAELDMHAGGDVYAQEVEVWEGGAVVATWERERSVRGGDSWNEWRRFPPERSGGA